VSRHSVLYHRAHLDSHREQKAASVNILAIHWLRFSWAPVLALALTGCGLFKTHPPAEQAGTSVPPFSAETPGTAIDQGWKAAGLPKFRKSTRYELVNDDGTTVVHAIAERSSSGLIHDVSIDPRQLPIMRWRWKVPRLIPGADNTKRQTEDAPARIEVAFYGKVNKLPFEDRLFFAQVRAVAGIEVPYATLEYVWGNGAPAGTIIANSWTARIQMLLVKSGGDSLGQWVSEQRNVYKDFKEAFGEEPGNIIYVGLYTDADATGTTAEAYYGDIEFVR
jgi:hypothetical protein